MDINSYSYKKPYVMNSNRVYINPNFSSNLATMTYAQRESPSMHFNPNFSNNKPQVDRGCSNNVTRIFINPNFVKPGIGPSTVQSVTTTQHNILGNAHNVIKLDAEPTIHCTKIPLSTVKRSRYSLVRHGAITVDEKKITEQPSKTIKISKYKTVLLSDIKNNMYENTPEKIQFTNVRKSNLLPSNNKNIINLGPINKCINKYKFIKNRISTESLDGYKRIVNNKISSKKNYKVKTKETKRMFKKNNIPCPLFKKFGKCIRNMHGKCEFLHDKKHVTLCRKFLKGICFDNNCLLSHDVSTKKMPTCYFFLKGMCTKVDCPYLHVKLNENTKICPDFLKGYCEKGNKCINRHVTVPDITKKQSRNKDQNAEKIKTRKKIIKIKKSIVIPKSSPINETPQDEKGNIKEGRYYLDREKLPDLTTDTSEVIKPTRCKLGSLPSFIQLK